MVANHQMKVIGWEKLRLTLEETAGITELQSEEKLPEKTVERLHQAADGWAAGLMLMVDQAKTEGIDPESMGKSTPEEIFDYFAGESFSRADAETQDFLLKTAFLPKMTATMAKELTGRPNAGETEAAVFLLQNAEDWEGIIQLIMAHASEMLA